MSNRYVPRELLSSLAHLRRQVAQTESELRNLQSQCVHEWGETEYTPIVREAYTIEADLPGTMGVDWRPAQHVPREETPK